MSLSNQLKAYADKAESTYSKEYLQLTDWSIKSLKASDLLKRTLKTRDSLPNGTLLNSNSKEVQIYDLLKQTPLVITFYRGGWCPYCNLQLKAMQGILQDIVEKGASLVAITPELPDASIATKHKNELSFTILSDVDNTYANALSLAYSLPPDLVNIYQKNGIDLIKNQNNKDTQLPIPATYIVNQVGEITYHFLDPDYKNRAELEHILEAL